MKNERGFIHIIIYLLIFAIFMLTVYICLDILNLIDVPDKYSVAKWLQGHTETVSVVEDAAGDTADEVRVEIEKIQEKTYEHGEPINTADYHSQQEVYEEIDEGQQAAYSYYAQLDAYAKTIYDELDKHLDDMKSGNYNVQFGKTFDDMLHEENGEETLNQAFQLAINALNFDNPELFFLDISKINLLTKITTKLWSTTYEVEIGAVEGQSYLNQTFGSKEDVNRAIGRIEVEKARIKANCGDDVESQIKGVHDYLVDNLEYDSSVSKDNIYNIYGALINRCTVCEGYARAFKAMMDDFGIPCLIACGTGINSNGSSESHAWNYVQLGGTWYAIDVTWDDPVIIGNGYVSRNVNYRYYLKGSDEFFKNHIEKGDIVGDVSFQYPAISENGY